VQSLEAAPKVVGSKQTIRAIESNQVSVVFIARDTQEQLQDQLIECANKHQVEIVFYDSMEALGEACNVEVKTATAALIK
jgi:large subunit ribosomal protein L7A